jgi:hypothetical protein
MVLANRGKVELMAVGYVFHDYFGRIKLFGLVFRSFGLVYGIIKKRRHK